MSAIQDELRQFRYAGLNIGGGVEAFKWEYPEMLAKHENLRVALAQIAMAEALIFSVFREESNKENIDNGDC